VRAASPSSIATAASRCRRTARRLNRHGAKSKAKEARGDTYQREAEGKSHVGAARGRARSGDTTNEELYDKARKRHIEERSKMSKQQLENALHARRRRTSRMPGRVSHVCIL